MQEPIEANQYTLRRAVHCRGVGLHTGKPVNMTIRPAPADSGIHFHRIDRKGRAVIPARCNRIVDTTLATTLSNGTAKVSTTEHLLAALRGSGIDNAWIELDSHEVPIMDGSAGPFVLLLKRGGLKKQDAPRRAIRITRPISYIRGERSIRVEPFDGFKVTGSIQFDDNFKQTYSIEVTRERFWDEIARARTFGFVEQVEQLWTNGLALGGTLANVIAIHWDRRSILNEDGLRFDDEFIRHKVLDLIGDLALLGCPLLGHVIADRSGHGLHRGLMKNIIRQTDRWEYLQLKRNGGSVRKKVISQRKYFGSNGQSTAMVASILGRVGTGSAVATAVG